MGFFTNLNTAFKAHSYSIVTAVVIGLLCFGYVAVVLPGNVAREDSNNITVFKNIEVQLKKYIDDQLNEVDNKKALQRNPQTRNFELVSADSIIRQSDFYINRITIDSVAFDTIRRTINLSRRIEVTNDKENGYLFDEIKVDVSQYFNRIASMTNFTSFYLCTVDNRQKCVARHPILAKGVSLKDQDSLSHNCRSNGPFAFKKSVRRYYADQITIPETTFTFFVAAGVDANYFQSRVREIKPELLIFSLLLTIILTLSISFIKPVISSFKERLYQMDLVSVVFSVGVLTAVLIVFGIQSYWNATLKARSETDLQKMVGHIDTSFRNELNVYLDWKKPNHLFGEVWNPKNSAPFSRIYVLDSGKIGSTNFLPVKSLNKNAMVIPSDSLAKPRKYAKDAQISALLPDKKLALASLDGYFRMNGSGLITTYVSNDNPGIPRKYSDRMYFRTLRNDTIKRILTGVFSRDNNEYQWIYAERDSVYEDRTASNDGIRGIAFRTNFHKKIKLPPGTDYMIVDRKGEVLMQNDPNKNLYQNLLLGAEDKTELQSLLSGVYPQSFEMTYQGTIYQVYAQKLSIASDFPVYVLGIRDLSHLNRLSLFTFSNAFLMSIVYGILILLLTLMYSALLYTGHIGIFSRQHFYYLFPDNSRTQEYRILFWFNCFSVFAAMATSMMTTPSTALFCCAIFGVNTAFVNLIVLNIRTFISRRKRAVTILLFLLLSISMSLFLLSIDEPAWAIIMLFALHIGVILYYKYWSLRKAVDTQRYIAANKGVNRKVYLRFVTVMVVNHFAIFPFILCNSLYVAEMNDFSAYYCSPSQTEQTQKEYTVNAYGCNCNDKPKAYILCKTHDGIVRSANFRILTRPALVEVKKFSLDCFFEDYFLTSRTIFQTANEYLFITAIVFALLVLLIYSLLNYYSNRFFFYDLMQAAYEGYYPCRKNKFATPYSFITKVSNRDVRNLIQHDPDALENTPVPIDPNCPDRTTTIEKLFDKSKDNEIQPNLRMEFILNYNDINYNKKYLEIWDSLPSDEARNVLFDFAQDHFANYKNKDILMQLMEVGVIDHDKITGRLKVMSLSFRNYIVSKSNRDEAFREKYSEIIENNELESKQGTFGKLKFPIIILAVSLLVLLMYLNKDSYDRVALVGSSIGSALLLVDKFLSFSKPK
jgi:hypothetical protein